MEHYLIDVGRLDNDEYLHDPKIRQVIKSLSDEKIQQAFLPILSITKTGPTTITTIK